MRQANPYRPGFNQAPLVLAGREGLLRDAQEALEVAAYDGRTPRPLVLIGPRGVGKTVTLGEIAELAAVGFSWPTVHVEATAGSRLTDDLRVRLLQVAGLLDGQVPTSRRRRSRVTGGAVSAQVLGVGGEVRVEVDPAEQPSLATVMQEAMDRAMARGAGLVITLDELQVAEPAQVGVLFALLQENVPRDWPLVVAVAALPSVRVTRGRAALPTYLERAEWHELGPLDVDAARRALVEPAARSGRPMTAAATAELLALAGGYPYALQVAGHFAWRSSHGAEQITVAHARAARPRIEADLDQLYAGRWDGASGREREYLSAIAELAVDEPPTSSTVAAHLGATTSEVSYLRERLIKKGTIYVTADSRLHLIAPGMGGWIRRTTHSGAPARS